MQVALALDDRFAVPPHGTGDKCQEWDSNHHDCKGTHRGGAGLRLTARITVGDVSQITVLDRNIPQVWWAHDVRLKRVSPVLRPSLKSSKIDHLDATHLR